jgi:hypothetical protein
MKEQGNGKVRMLIIGAGTSPMEGAGWAGAEVTRADVARETNPDVGIDCLWELPELGEFDVVVATHALQCVPRTKVVETLKHWSTLVRPGGELHVVVPDLGWAADEVAAERSVDKMTLGVIYGTQQAEWAFHRTGFTVDLLRAAVYAAGLHARASRLGPYELTSVGADGQVRKLVARQIYVVAVRPDRNTDQHADDRTTTDRDVDGRTGTDEEER